MAPIEPTMATPVAACESIVAVGTVVGICVDVFVAEGAKVAVTSGEGVTGVIPGEVGVAGRGDAGGTGVCVTVKACENNPQERENRTTDNGKNLRTFNIRISFLKNGDYH
jgi:hypothetical protein